jgi:rhodanese-related sulfurtransferase
MLRPLALAAALVLTACAKPAPPTSPSTPAPAAATRSVGGKRAKALVAAGAKLVDVRSPQEFTEGHLDGAVNVPSAEIANTDFGPKDKTIVVYCGSGVRSAKAAAKLESRGYTEVYDLGAMSTWDE